LKLKTAGTNWNVTVFTGSAADLRHQPLPAIITVSDPGVPKGLRGIGNRHSMVVFSYSDDKHIILGDPFTGYRQRWTLKELDQAYQSGGMALVRAGK
jgi:hypothetical protein